MKKCKHCGQLIELYRGRWAVGGIETGAISCQALEARMGYPWPVPFHEPEDKENLFDKIYNRLK